MKQRMALKGALKKLLGAPEYRILLALLQRPDHLVTCAHLKDVICGINNIESNSSSCAAFIYQWRLKLSEDFVTTLHGNGDMFGQTQK